MRRIASVAGTVVVVAFVLLLGYLRFWNVFVQAKLGEPCHGRAGCRSFQCLSHERVAGAERATAGYCTAPCKDDEDCAAAGLACVMPSRAALDDLPKYGRPDKLCMRVRAAAP